MSIDLDTIKAKTRAIISENLCIRLEEVRDAASLADDFYADSLDLIETLMALEEEFGIDIQDETASGWKTVGDIIETVTDLIAMKDGVDKPQKPGII